MIWRYVRGRIAKKALYKTRGYLFGLNVGGNWYKRGPYYYQIHRDGVITKKLHWTQYRGRQAAPKIAAYGPPAYWEYRGFRRNERQRRTYSRNRRYY